MDDTSSKEANNIIYKALEKVASEEVAKLSSYVEKRTNSTSKTSREFYDKKIKKTRDKCLEYFLQMKSYAPTEETKDKDDD